VDESGGGGELQELHWKWPPERKSRIVALDINTREKQVPESLAAKPREINILQWRKASTKCSQRYSIYYY
jgi:hypothetical protein